MRTKNIKLALSLTIIVLLAGLFCSPANAALSSVERYNKYSMSFDNSADFANAKGSDAIWQKWAGSYGDSGTFGWTLVAGASVIGTGVANMSVDSQSWNSGTGAFDWTLTKTSGGLGETKIQVDYDATGYIGISGGQYFLQRSYTSRGGVDDGYPYYWQMVLPGDWSASGTGMGEHELLGFNSTYWTIDKNFVYDNISNTTTFLAYDYDYTNGNNIDITFKLWGGRVPVPEPTAVLLLGLGLIGLAGVRRKMK